MTLPPFPTLNALLNLTAATCLLRGRRAIRRGDRAHHIRWMVAALIASAFFLTSYITYHVSHEPTRYQGTGLLRGLYFFILITHIPLAALVVPASLTAVRQAWRGRYDRHVRITRVLWPVWMYVSVTGVAIYLMLYIL